MFNQPVANCSNCGHNNPPGSRFCNACGSPIVPAAEETIAGPATPPPLPVVGPTIAAGTRPAAPSPALATGATIDPAGRYAIERAIGRGGFGQAYLVYDHRLNRYCVAKHLTLNPAWSEHARATALHNFRREAQLLVTLNAPGHPNIPEIYEYLPESSCLVMKYIEGRNLDEVLRTQGGLLPEPEALSLIRDICAALVYMHSRQPEPVLHRDIKPSNMILDNAGRVWLIDFGLSKAVPARLVVEDPQRTQLAGTPGFTPPEQWLGEAEPRSDIYALAATLHTLLTGYRPAIARQELVDLTRGKRSPFPPVRQLNPAIHPDIEALIQAGLAHRPQDRPAASEFLAALDARLAPSGLSAIQTPSGHRISDEHELARWAESHWDEAAAWLYQNLALQIETLLGKNRLAAEIRTIIAQYADNQYAGLDALIAHLDPQGFGATRPRIAADLKQIDFGGMTADGRAERWLNISNSGRRYVRLEVQTPRWIIAGPPLVSLIPGQQVRLRLAADMRRVEAGGRLREAVVLFDRSSGVGFRIETQVSLNRWRALWSGATLRNSTREWHQGRVRKLHNLAGHRGGAWALAFSPDGAYLASGGYDQTIRIWRPADGMLLGTLADHNANVLSLCFSPTSHLLASSGADEMVRIWRVEDERLLVSMTANAGYFDGLCFSPDGQLVLAAGGDRAVHAWRLRDGASLRKIPGGAGIVGLALNPDGTTLLIGGNDGRIRLYALETGEQLGQLATPGVRISTMTLNIDGQLLAAGAIDGNIYLWNMADGTALPRLIGHQGEVRSLSFHPDGELLASGGIDGTLQLWRVRDGVQVQSLTGHSSGVTRTCFSPDGTLLASSGGDGAVVLWGV